jgi:hypothetical protein
MLLWTGMRGVFACGKGQAKFPHGGRLRGLAQEIVEDLEDALEQFSSMVNRLKVRV